MPALTAAPPKLELPATFFVGRSLHEYAQCFTLDPDKLRHLVVLDVGAGASSFVAEACRRGADAVAVDPLYGVSVHELSNRVRTDYDRMSAQIPSKPQRSRMNGRTKPVGARWPKAVPVAKPRLRACSPAPDAAEVDRKAAAQRFLADYEVHFSRGRYVAAGLPRLPFLDRAFDLVLCAHPLFSDTASAGFAWHVAACRELVRVSAGEVRIHPLAGADGRRYPELDDLRQELLTCGVRSEVMNVSGELLVEGGSTLILNPGKRN